MKIALKSLLMVACFVATFGTSWHAAWAAPPTVAVSPNPYNGTCPKTLNFTGTITATSPGTISYAFSYIPPGEKTPALAQVQSVKVKSAGPVSVATTGIVIWSGTGSLMLYETSPVSAQSKPVTITTICSSSTAHSYPTSSSSRYQAGPPPLVNAQTMPDVVKQHKLTAVEFQADVARFSRTITGKSHFFVKNPHATSQNMRIFASLAQQRKLADQEFTRMRTTTGRVILQRTPPPTIAPGKPLDESGSSTPTPTATAPPVTGGAPLSREEASFVFLHQLEAGMCNPYFSDPVIHTVNGSNPMTFTPTQAFDLYTIQGCNFGDFSSNSRVWIYKAGFKENFEMLSWGNNSIAVMLDPNLSGLLDQDNLTLVVQRSDGKQAQASGFAFYAARDQVQLALVPAGWVTLSSWDSSSSSYASPAAGFLMPQAAVGSSNFVFRGYVPAKSAGDSDYYEFSQLPAGWIVNGLDWTEYDSCAGVVTYKGNFGSWGPQWEGLSGNFHFQWGETTCSGWMPNPFPWMGWYSNDAESRYSLRVRVEGPRGTENLLPH